MTICIATDSFPPHNSGIATHNSYLSRLLQENGNKVIVLTADFENRNDPDSVTRQGEITVVTLKRSYGEQFRYFSQFIRSGNREAVVWLSLGKAMRNWLLEHNPEYSFDIVECSDYGGFGLFLIDPILPPVVVMCHGMLTQLDKQEFHNQDENLSLIRFLETNMIRHADTVICHSQSNTEAVARDFEVTTLYATAPWIHDPIVPGLPEQLEFVIASRLQVCKGALVMAAVLESIIKDHPGIKINWYGEDTYTAPGGWMVSKYIRKHFPGVWQKNFNWKSTLPRKDMLGVLAASRAIIIPSTWETFNYVALEAANCKKALIITKQAGISSLLSDGENCLLVDANDIASIREAMIRIHEENELASKLGNNLFQASLEKIDKQNFLTDRKEAYTLAMERRKIKPPVNPLTAFFEK